MVFQEYNLVERLTVMENLLTGRLGYLGLQGLDPPLRARGHRARLPAAGHRGLAGFADQRADALSAASASAWASPAR